MEIIYKSIIFIIKQCLKYGIDFFVIEKLQKNTIYYDHRYSLNAMNKFNQLPELMPIRSCMWRLPNSRKVLVFIRCSKASAKFAISDAW